MSDILSIVLRSSTIEELEWIRDEVDHELRRRGKPSVGLDPGVAVQLTDVISGIHGHPGKPCWLGCTEPVCGAYSEHVLTDDRGCPQAPGHEGNHGPRCTNCKDRGGYCVYCWEGDL